MILQGTEFGHVFNASGARNITGTGYWFHHLPFIGADFSDSTFITKTVTLEERKGNMPLAPNGLTPIEPIPRCIIVNPFKGIVLNAVGLSNFGMDFYLNDFRPGPLWQERQKPFVISFMAVGNTKAERLSELRLFAAKLKNKLPYFQAPIALQMNYSCPNTGHDLDALMEEVDDGLIIASILNVPLICKFNVLLPIEHALQIQSFGDCNAISMSNAVPWGELPDRIDWVGLFGSMESPLAKRFGSNVKGGLSGKPLLPLVESWIKRARAAGLTLPIMGGGGVLDKDDADRLIHAGASAIEIGSAAILRPWRVQDIIRHVNTRLAT